MFKLPKMHKYVHNTQYVMLLFTFQINVFQCFRIYGYGIVKCRWRCVHLHNLGCFISRQVLHLFSFLISRSVISKVQDNFTKTGFGQDTRSKFTFVVDGSTISQTGNTKFYEKPKGKGWCQFASHEQLRPLFRDGKLTITCSVEFDISEPEISVPRVFQLFEHVSMDVEFVVGSKRVPAHKNFITMISPVFQAMLNNTTESESGEVEITEFDYETVKAAIDICYGRESTKMPVETVVNIHRFCDRYVITAVINELAKLLILKLSVQDFCTIVQYAYDFNKEKLLTACHKFFKDHQGRTKATENFAKLPPALVVSMLKSAFNLKTDYDVLRHAHKYSIVFVMNYLEQPLIKSMTMDHIVTAINFAFGYSRKNLKKACLKYFNANRDEIMSMNTFYMLDSATIGNLMKASHNAK